MQSPLLDYLSQFKNSSKGLASIEFAKFLDEKDAVAHLRNEFCIPLKRHLSKSFSNGDEEESVYLCGNSLGLQPKRTRVLLEQELKVWAEKGVEGHVDHEFNRPWAEIDQTVVGKCAEIVGAKPAEVAIMTTLTTNLHLAMLAFYKPKSNRYKIITDSKAFPSDQYAVRSQIEFHGYDPSVAHVELTPREGEYTVSTEDVLAAIEEHGEETALVMIAGIQYYTGQLYDIERITQKAKAYNCTVGWDLAHAVGNVPLSLHDWDVDFAVWCTYKYLNSGPGSIGGLFVHEKFNLNKPQHLCGWWGHVDRFAMDNIYTERSGAQGFQLSNPSVFATIPLLASLEVFGKTNMSVLRAKSILLSEFLVALLKEKLPLGSYEVLTPLNYRERGSQISLLFKGKAGFICSELLKRGVVCDKREPDVIRVSPIPLYNRFVDVFAFVRELGQILKA